MADIKDLSGITWTLFTVFIGLLVYKVWPWIKPRNFGDNIPPFPVPRKFLLGHLHLYIAKKELETIKTLREKAGDVFSLDLAGKLVVVVNGFEAVKDVLVNHWNEAPDRPNSGVPSLIGEDNHGVLNSRGENWKDQRTAALLILRSLGMGKNILAEKICKEVSIYIDKLASFNGKPVDINILTGVSVSNITCSIIVGKRYDHDDPYFVHLIETINNVFSKAPRVAIMQTIPFARFIPGDFFGLKYYMGCMNELNVKFSKAQITEAKKTFNPEDEPKTFITAYLQRMHEEDAKGTPHRLDEKNLISTIRSLFIGGTETTTTSIYWFVLHCINHPDVQDKIFVEISSQVGLDRLPNMNDKVNLRYLEAAIRESMRCASLAPFFLRKVSQSFELKGYTIPEGSLILWSLRSAHHDNSPWGDPEKFRPERFLDDTGNLIKFEEHIPFGLGKRSCLAEAMARMELFLFLSAMFQRFRFEPEIPGELPSMEGKMEIAYKPQPYKVRIVARHLNK
ncbi:cytochrome p450 2c8 [Plakobranchus ocellatus]|uniref:Cytochrome p450 2c8 n=1 Tax=Plakobranchus ocellatus TaxID=259542 RepID=A0AAV4A3K4_9GAST|nr:cytochrome p450 2c8 [Plakobranchus ocellatus]